MDSKKIAEGIKKEDRESATVDYIKEATANQKEAAENLNNIVDNANDAFSKILEETKEHEDYNKIVSTIANVNSLISKAKNGGNINDIIKQIEALK